MLAILCLFSYKCGSQESKIREPKVFRRHCPWKQGRSNTAVEYVISFRLFFTTFANKLFPACSLPYIPPSHLLPRFMVPQGLVPTNVNEFPKQNKAQQSGPCLTLGRT